MNIEARLAALGLMLPPPVVVPPTVRFPFAFVRVAGNRAYVAGHAPQGPDGRVARPLGKVGTDLTVEQGYEAASNFAIQTKTAPGGAVAKRPHRAVALERVKGIEPSS